MLHRVISVIVFAYFAQDTTNGFAESARSETDFQAQADLPPLLAFADGTLVRDSSQWPDRRGEIEHLMLNFFVGSFPKHAPELLGKRVLRQQRLADGSLRQDLELTLDTPNRVKIPLQVWTPSGNGPFPLLLTQPRYYQMPWAELALRRGYMVALYAGVDSHHREDAFPGYDSVWRAVRREYPDATWTEISTKAWIGSRCLDHLLDKEQNYPVIKNQVGIIGFSRYGKQSMIAAAFDQRIKAVVARSPGSPGATPYRFTSRHTFGETPVDFPGEWFSSKLKAFYGREHELPMDAHGWLGLIAPRHLLIHTAYNDGSEPTFAAERAVLQARKVYKLLGSTENLCLLYRPGQHNPITDAHRISNIDWFDYAFKRNGTARSRFPDGWIHRFDWDEWRAKQLKEHVTPPEPSSATSKTRAEIISRVQWAIGEPSEPPRADDTSPFLTPEESAMMTHDRWAPAGIDRRPVRFGDKVRGNIYVGSESSGPMPAVIWLHPLSYHSGYNEGYGVQGTTIYHRLAQQGYVVLAFDQCGFGLRLLEGRDFYSTQPHWSRLGRMIQDVRAAVDLLVDSKGQVQGERPAIKVDQVFVVGYSIGGATGLYSAALDRRIAGVASFCGFTPMRTDTDGRTTGGIRRWWEWHGLQPKLGLFHGQQHNLPYDFDDIITLIAPRPCLIYTPKRDRTAAYEDVAACIARTRQRIRDSQVQDKITFASPDDVNRFQSDQHDVLIEWLKQRTEDGD